MRNVWLLYDRGRVSKLEPNIIRGSPSSQTPYAHSSLLPIFSAHNKHTITRNTTNTQLQVALDLAILIIFGYPLHSVHLSPLYCTAVRISVAWTSQCKEVYKICDICTCDIHVTDMWHTRDRHVTDMLNISAFDSDKHGRQHILNISTFDINWWRNSIVE